MTPPRKIILRKSGETAQAPEPDDDNAEVGVADLPHQRKRSEAGRFLLQVDRQTKGSYATMEAAEAEGLKIKTAHPVVQVSVYDSIDTVNKLILLPRA